MLKGVRFLLHFCWKFNKKFIAYEMIASLCKSLVPFIAIILPRFIIDELTGKQRIDILMIYVLLFAGGNFIGSSLTTFFMGMTLREKNILFNKFQLYLSDNLIEADFEQIESVDFLKMKDKAYKYLYGDGRGFATIFDDFSNIIGQVITVLGIVVIIATLNVFVVIALLLLICFSTYLESLYQRKQYELNMKRVDIERKNAYFMRLIESFEYGKEIRIYNMKNWLKYKYNETLTQLNDFYRILTTEMMKTNIGKAFGTFIEQGIVYVYLVRGVLNYTIGLGEFTMYVSAVNSLSTSLKQVMVGFVSIRKSENYFREMDYFLHLPKERYNGNQTELDKARTDYTIEFKNVSFAYPNHSQKVLKNISVKINFGEKLAIVGENGAGKTTFIKLLLRLYEPSEGEILLNDVNIKEIKYEDYLELFSVVFQDFQLFAFSIKENITLGNPINEHLLFQYIEDSGLKVKIDSLVQGIDTSLYKIFDENGVELSGGEGQKLALARALYKNSPLVILDEPTAALDPRAEHELYQHFNKFTKSKTAIYISHRLSSTKFCDKILVFNCGEIKEYGSHQELMKKNGLYTELFQMQAEQFKETQ